ncbi:MAG TPA: CAP domain-containing protein [Kribbella sp.]|nr:CAP domain-containing protein [Kribbella sp.]
MSALSVLLAVGPVVWVMTSNDGSSTADEPAKVLHVSEGNSAPGALSVGPDATIGSPGVTTTSADGTTTSGTPVGSPTGTTSSVPVTTRQTTASVTVSPPATPRTTTKPKPSRPTTTAPTGGGSSALERQVLDLTNAARQDKGCRPLSLESSLVEAAGEHASDMVRRHFFDHNNPDGKSPFDRMEAAGFRGSAMAENIAVGYTSAQAVFDGWMKSSGHRKNILNCSYNKIGIGYDPGQVKSEWGNGSWVQDFGRN